MTAQSYAFLIEVDRPESVTALRHALTAAGIPYQTGLQADGSPHVVFFVPWRHLSAARDLLGPDRDDPDDDEDEFLDDDTPAVFPRGPVQAVLLVGLFNLSLVLWAGGSLWSGQPLSRLAGLIGGATSQEPWRLVTSLFVHADPRHVFWNAVSMMVFAVPLITGFGYARTALVYLASGVGGGLCALTFATVGQTTIGSSGAVAGLFGAWCVFSIFRNRRTGSRWRAWVRTLGIAWLVLPSLLTPVTPAGNPVSVSSHLGGLVTGMAVGAVICGGMLVRRGGWTRPHSVVVDS